jgi:hypothetical protein
MYFLYCFGGFITSQAMEWKVRKIFVCEGGWWLRDKILFFVRNVSLIKWMLRVIYDHWNRESFQKHEKIKKSGDFFWLSSSNSHFVPFMVIILLSLILVSRPSRTDKRIADWEALNHPELSDFEGAYSNEKADLMKLKHCVIYIDGPINVSKSERSLRLPVCYPTVSVEVHWTSVVSFVSKKIMRIHLSIHALPVFRWLWPNPGDI